jgi:hypothetical protein
LTALTMSLLNCRENEGQREGIAKLTVVSDNNTMKPSATLSFRNGFHEGDTQQMSQRKQRREIDKAIAHLMAYLEQNDTWGERFDEFLSHMMAPVADRLAISVDEVEAYLLDGPYGNLAWGYLFEALATSPWDGEEHSMVDVYLKQRGWREGPAGRRYLQALNSARIALWEVTDVKVGAYVEIRPFGSHDQPTQVKEKSATEALHPWDCLAARVLRLDGSHLFAGGMLPLTPTEAASVQRVLDSVPAEFKELLQMAVDDGDLNALPDNIDDRVASEVQSQLPEIAFTVWALAVYHDDNPPLPQLFNMDDEPIQLTRQRFPIRGERHQIEAALDGSPVLNGDAEAGWSWFPKPFAAIADDEQVNIHGHIFLNESAVELETNSRERAERGNVLLATLLGDLVDTPLTVHENLADHLDTDMDSDSACDLNASPEVQAVLQSHLTQHYRQTLDEPIPMLDNKTPRECARDPERQAEVIRWLKFLENSDQRSPQPGYDFSWMWEELNLEPGS